MTINEIKVAIRAMNKSTKLCNIATLLGVSIFDVKTAVNQISHENYIHNMYEQHEQNMRDFKIRYAKILAWRKEKEKYHAKDKSW
jgi:hypothetical protein